VENDDDDIVETAAAEICLDTWQTDGVTDSITLFVKNKVVDSIILLILVVAGIVHFKSTFV